MFSQEPSPCSTFVIIRPYRLVGATALYVGAIVILYAIVIHTVTGTILILDPDAGAFTASP